MRVAIGGFQHETNTFAPQKAGLNAFVQPDAWPGMQVGAALLETFRKPAPARAPMNVPVAGFLHAAGELGFEVVPLVWAAATPSAHVTTDAYAQIAGLMVEGLERAQAEGPLDAVYLDLHGAMVTEDMEDGEGELLEWVRDVVGARTLIAASLDVHANVTAKMVRNADLLVAYRTYPHVDMARTGARAARLLDEIVTSGRRPKKALRKINYLVPLTAQCTMNDPAAMLYADVSALDGAELEHGRVLGASLTMGFPLADIAECGPAVIAYAETQAAADEAAGQLAEAMRQFERAFRQKLWDPEEAVAYGEAADEADRARGPLVLADTQDNPGAGGNGDTVGLLRALISGARSALCGVIYDPATAAAAWQAGEGARLRVSLGAWTGGAPEEPIDAVATVVRLHDGEIDAHGPFYAGAMLSLGPSAMLAIGGVRVIVSSTKVQTADRAMFAAFGADPARENIVALKSSVHFRADFQSIARDILVVASPGPNPADHTHLPYRRLRNGVRLMPAGHTFQRSRKPSR